MFCSIHKLKLCLTIAFSIIIVVSASDDKENVPYDSRASRGVGGSAGGGPGASGGSSGGSGGGSGHSLESRNSYAMLSQAMSHAVNHEFHSAGSGGSTDGSCLEHDAECHHDHLGMEAIKLLHRQLDDDDNGDIDLSESDDFLREELKYDSGYEKRHKAFHYNDDMHISVKELWQAWTKSEVHNWTVEQTTEWLAQSVQLPQYVNVFKKHKVDGKILPRIAVHNLHYVSSVLGVKDPIHKQKIALKAMDAVLFGPPRETGTRWKDWLLLTLILVAIFGSWYAYQQNKNAKIHLRRMVRDMEGLQKAENALQDMQKELEKARMEQENVGKEKQDLERRLKEAPLSSSSSNSDLELLRLKQEVELLRNQLSQAEDEMVDHWAPPQALQHWLQLTYEYESKNQTKKRICAEQQLQLAREACEKLRKKRSSLVGAFVSTHGKSIHDVDRSIVEARNSLNEVTNDLQERLHRWKQIESFLGFSIVNNSGIAALENMLYRNGSGKSSSRARISSSQDDLDDDSVQGIYDNYGTSGCRDDSSASDECEKDTVTFIVGSGTALQQLGGIKSSGSVSLASTPSTTSQQQLASSSSASFPASPSSISNQMPNFNDSSQNLIDETRLSKTSLNDGILPLPRTKKSPLAPPQPFSTGSSVNTPSTTAAPSTLTAAVTSTISLNNRAPMPPPRRLNSQQSTNMVRSESFNLVPMESTSSYISSTTFITEPQPDDTYSTDSSSFDGGEIKKHRKKLHFPFGKKSKKSKDA